LEPAEEEEERLVLDVVMSTLNDLRIIHDVKW
jgi:hypothetical protein